VRGRSFKPRGTCAPAGSYNPGLDGNIGKRPVTVIVVENVMSKFVT